MAMVKPAPVVGWRWWWRGRVGYAGRSSEMTLRLGRGTWDISLQYDSVVPVTVSAAGLSAVLPPNLEPLGPYSSVGVLRLPHVQSVRFVLHYHRLPLPGRLLGSTGETRAPTPTGLVPRGRLVAVQGPFRDQAIPLHQACGRYVDWYRVFRPARLGK
jgi:hypothetical protein